MKPYKNQSIVISLQLSSILKFSGGIVLTLILIFSLTGILTTVKSEYRMNSNLVTDASQHISGKVLYHLIASENHVLGSSLEDSSNSIPIGNILFNLVTNISFKDPRSFIGRELPGFYMFDSKILVAGEGTDYTNLPIESVPPEKIFKSNKDPDLKNTENITGTQKRDSKEKKQDTALTTGNRKVVFLYFTHTRESYLPYLKGIKDPNAASHSKINVTMVGEKLKEELEDRGIGTTIDKTDVQNLLLKKGWKYGQSYLESRELVQTAMAQDRDLNYFIDIHRDSERKKKTTAIINGQSYAKISFIIGGENPNHEKNVQLAKELHSRLERKYKGLSKGIIQKAGASTNGKFNQDLSSNSFLIEVGGVDNTFEEMYRTVTALADVFSDYYWQAEKVDGKQPPAKN
ncbi:stage II sporulation protein P [Heyndrickxia shackletonii]|uniref:Stage II sporulation protein P n=1 Tax=Heyndrickxia shackletonii TaxID=157838 RepID=A0A0Q3WWT5_9BACI|nr:stage II sporulation protein P [Heyndrickxia shackletonii]KQL53490.1 stage II sporulation protein P [Heyndrickxia shackletonii]NEY99564.1 stage II sporulation protein P [Heyndrickxia shackletonii]